MSGAGEFALKRLAASSAAALDLGKAAEHIVCADLILQGRRAYLSDQGLPYDVVLDVDGRLLRIQVKSTCFARDVNSKGRSIRNAYSFSVRRNGKDGRKRLSDQFVDLVALVALDIRIVAYMPIGIVSQTVQLLPPGPKPDPKTWRSGWQRTIDEWPLADALVGPSAYRKATSLGERMTCRHGHVLAEVGLVDNGKTCAECGRIRSRAFQKKLRGER